MKTQTGFLKATGFFTLICFVMASCSSTTLIRSSDTDAKIYIDGEFAGKGLASHTDQKIVGSTTRVTFKKDGCAPDDHLIMKNEELQVGPLIGGLFFLFPFIWIMGYKSEHSYEYGCSKAS